jgi:hypothetical protein
MEVGERGRLWWQVGGTKENGREVGKGCRGQHGGQPVKEGRGRKEARVAGWARESTRAQGRQGRHAGKRSGRQASKKKKGVVASI